MKKQIQLSREALGTPRYKYTAGVTRQADGTFELTVAAVGLNGAHRMPQPSPTLRPFSADDIDGLGTSAAALPRQWRDAPPRGGHQGLCFPKAVGHALARAPHKLPPPPAALTP